MKKEIVMKLSSILNAVAVPLGITLGLGALVGKQELDLRAKESERQERIEAAFSKIKIEPTRLDGPL